MTKPMKPRKTRALFRLTALGLVLFAGVLAPLCAAGKKDAPKDAITLISREDGSGTRSAFIELFGVLDQNKADQTSPRAEITNNTAVMLSSVAGDPNAIGYISLGSLNSTVRAVKIDGVEATVPHAADGSYSISRPFLIAVKEPVSPLAGDFINFILSREGQDTIAKNHYIRVADTGPFAGGGIAGKLVIAGSSSVSPAMEKLKEAYLLFNPQADIAIQQSDSSAGLSSLINGICGIAMASRELKSAETNKGVQGRVIAMDGIAVIVHKNNPVSDMTKAQVRAVFTGEITRWQALGK
ncbi:MAG: substrate-binding domain-containing protein [Treponema sp.]|nr:substrate-binding domain-containing protein [Treponema sp.]